ncbi:MAG TPA: dihydroorotase [Persephonella sp.]|uniref:Dihydroorotase n=1 Tax=Persephonella marina (strain DSM 14350 / EX-H1) TaxID=123214 RepID=C0QUR2_PERMH|nr:MULTISPECIES: dihydroorotase [Persephonella]ACO04555.1 dihydroorotase (DHOase) [Persephonella marina EX-H1]HCB69957.1 dihydroorotase [Persephonella sp.]
MGSILIKNGFIVDPKQNIKKELDILIENGVIKKIDKDIQPFPGCEIIDATNCIVSPSFVDIHVHFRDPGQTYKEDLYTGSLSAVAGGYTTVVCMPNTIPALDEPSLVRYIVEKGEEIGLCRVLPAAAITKGREGKKLTEMSLLKEAGAVYFTDDGAPVMDAHVMRKAMEFAGSIGSFVADHCEDLNLSQDGVAHEGEISAALGLPPLPPEAEDTMVARDCVLSLHTGMPVHICHVSTKVAVEVITWAKAMGAPVTAEVTPHHLYLTDEEWLDFDCKAKVSPPLREHEDIEALRWALASGIIDFVATDHAPHAHQEKMLEHQHCPPGMIGLQFSLPIILELVRKDYFDIFRAIEVLSTKPAERIGIDPPQIKEGVKAELTVFDPTESWEVTEEVIKSKSKNTPLIGRKLIGKVKYTFYNGKIVFKD